MASKVGIINAALVSLGASTVSLPIYENSEVGRKVEAVYDIHLKAMLRAYCWNFAKKEVALSRTSETPVLTDFTYTYTLPADFIRLTMTSLQTTYKHKIKGQRIYSKSDTLSIEYIYFNEDPASYDDLFAEAFSAKLAAELCYPITKKTALVKTKWDEFAAKLREAKSANGQEISPEEPQADTFINSRE